MKALTAVALVVVAVGVGLFVRAKRWIDWPQMEAPSAQSGVNKFQVTGDPPITVSDGSLHAHSANDWVSDNASDTIIPKPATNSNGQYSTSCGLTVPNPLNPLSPTPVSGLLWTEDQSWDISPTDNGLTVKITHDTGGLDAGDTGKDDDKVVITISNLSTAPSIRTNKGTFGPPLGATPKQMADGRYNRQHSRPGDVSEIVVTGGTSIDWVVKNSSNPHNPHFTVAFCYQ